jgi:hypothetical protein
MAVNRTGDFSNRKQLMVQLAASLLKQTQAEMERRSIDVAEGVFVLCLSAVGLGVEYLKVDLAPDYTVELVEEMSTLVRERILAHVLGNAKEALEAELPAGSSQDEQERHMHAALAKMLVGVRAGGDARAVPLAVQIAVMAETVVAMVGLDRDLELDFETEKSLGEEVVRFIERRLPVRKDDPANN